MRCCAAGRFDERLDAPGEPELAGLIEDVNALAHSLADTERRRAQLVSDLAHELRTPLTTIRGYAEGMVDGIVVPDEAVLAAILDEVDRLGRLASDLATLSRADEGALDLHTAPIDVAVLATQVVARFELRADEKGVALQTSGSAHAPVVGDSERLSQVLANLVANAIAYTPDGGAVTVDVTTGEDRCTVTVTDTGIGLSAHDLERVFDRFYRVEDVERPPGGSGIGLAIAQAITRAHGGELTASSPGPGHGATFTLSLPGSGTGASGAR